MAYFKQFTREKIAARIAEIQDAMIRYREPLPLLMTRTEPPEGWQGAQFDARGWERLKAGNSFQACEEMLFLRSECRPPDEWRGLRLAAGLAFSTRCLFYGKLSGEKPQYAETLLYLDGRRLQGIDEYHREALLCEAIEEGEQHVLTAQMYVGLAGRYPQPEAPPSLVTVESAELRAIDPDACALYYDMYTAYESALTMERTNRMFTTVMRVLDDVTDILDFRAGRGDAFYRSIAAAREHLRQNLYKCYHAVAEYTPVLWCAGHAHIDNAWLWRVTHTRKKCERTFSTAVRFMKSFPGYKFTCSQAQQYEYVKEDNPELFEAIREAVRDGRWEPVGRMWVESDCNVTSGESLVRQFMYGTAFFDREFGKRSRVVWLPDVFGYSPALPQILRQCGFDYFCTIKISWSQVNRPLYHTFLWEGIDGSKILTHFAPLGDYNASLTPRQLKDSWVQYEQKHLTDCALHIYGHGDGGGGPSRSMLEMGSRLANFPEMPRVKFATAEEFFDELNKQVQGQPELPRWSGELYLEYHRGTYTSQAWIKRANRLSEIGLQTAEKMACTAALLRGAAYPRESLDAAWKMVLRNQFHDVVTGSSIQHVYRDCREDYAAVGEIIEKCGKAALQRLAEEVEGPAGDVLAYNPLSWARRGTVKVPRGHHIAGGQEITNLDGSVETLCRTEGVPPLGYAVLSPVTMPSENGLAISQHSLENRFFKIAIDEHAELLSVWDKRANREVLDRGHEFRGNSLLAFEDKPLKHDAWDIDIFYREKLERVQHLESLRVVEKGPLRCAVELERRFGRGSVLRQRICLYTDLPRVDFETAVDWRERQTLLKAAFPVAVHSRSATYEVQFGAYARPTHWNTTWDWARFEVYGHKWADLSESGYGVSILNDCKYGWDVRDNVMRLTLLRGPIHPDPHSDLGTHYFTYSLFPHVGGWREGGAVQAGYELNVPLQCASVSGGGRLPPRFSLLEAAAENLIVDTVKQSEDGRAVVARLYEAYGQRGESEVRFGREIERVDEVSLLETDVVEELGCGVNTVRLRYRPYEIKTLRICVGK